MAMRPLLSLLLLGLLAACGAEPEATAPLAASNLATQRVADPSVGGERRWDGVVEAVQRAELTAQTQGRVAAVLVDVDDRVVAGQELLRLDAVEQTAQLRAAQAQLRAANAAVQEADANYRRFQALGDKQYVSRAQLDQVRAARDSATAARDAAAEQARQSAQVAAYAVVRAPFAGVVALRSVEPGESVTTGQSLLTVLAPGELRVEVLVPEADAEAIRQAGKATVLTDDGRRIAATRVIVAPAADPDTHSSRVRLMLGDPALRPGMAVTALFPVAGNAQLWLPTSALVQRGEVSGFYVLVDGQPQLRQVRIGERRGDRVDVISGIAPGEQLLLDPVKAAQWLAARRRGEPARE